MENVKKLTRITDQQIKTMGVQALSDRPNASRQYGVGGLSANELKAWFDKLASFLAGKINEIHDTISGEEAAKYIRLTLDKYGIDTLDGLITAMENGSFAADVLAVLPSAEAKERETLQTVIYDIRRDIADSVAAATQEFKDMGYGYTSATVEYVENGGEPSAQVKIEDYDGGKRLKFIFYNSEGNSIFVRYSANADGENFTEDWREGQKYIGFATGTEAPTDKSGYNWGLFQISIDTKLDKVTTTGNTRVYAVDSHGNQKMIPAAVGDNDTRGADKIPLRNGKGNFYAGEPTENGHVATKQYADTKVTKITDTKNRKVAYTVDENNKQEYRVLATNAYSNTIMYRNPNGQCSVGAPTEDEHITNKKYVEDGFVQKLPTTSKNRVYIKRIEGNDDGVEFTASLVNHTIVSRDSAGNTAVALPTHPNHAANKQYVDTAINNAITSVLEASY